MTNDEALNAVATMGQLSEHGKLGYAIAKNLTKLKAETAEYSALRDELLTKYGEPVMRDGKATGTFTITGDNVQKYRDELGDVPNEQIEFTPYRVDEETFISGNLTSGQMATLIWMVKDDGTG